MERNYEIHDKEMLAVIRRLVLDKKHAWKKKLSVGRLLEEYGNIIQYMQI